MTRNQPTATGTRYRVVMLGAGRPVHGSQPSALSRVGERGCVLDWLLAAYRQLPDHRVSFVGGYRADEIIARYPDLQFTLNPDWHATGPAASLRRTPLDATTAVYLTYTDIVYRPEIIKQMQQVDADLVLAADFNWRTRFDGRSAHDCRRAERLGIRNGLLRFVDADDDPTPDQAEYAGVCRLSRQAAERLRTLFATGQVGDRQSIPDVLNALLDAGCSVDWVPVNNQSAELNATQDLARFVLGRKAESLTRLAPQLRNIHVVPSLTFTYADWSANRLECLQQVAQRFNDRSITVRSSADREDTGSASATGALTAVPEVPAAEPGAVAAALDRVFASYGAVDPADHVWVQLMLTDITLSGVLLTRTLERAAPYYVINYHESDFPDRITHTLIIHRAAPPPANWRAEWTTLLDAACEIEQLVGHDSLNLEFAFTADGRLHLLQIRPITVRHPDTPIDDQRVTDRLVEAYDWFDQLNRRAPTLVGERVVLSVMSDWNPAEIIGCEPRPLAFSLYRHLVTDDVWATQRAEYGYRDVRPCPLLVDCLGHPYVDVRASLNSFIPATLPDTLAADLVDHALAVLAIRPQLHDKLEFEVIATCLAPGFDRHAAHLRDAGFGPHDLALLGRALRNITAAGIDRCAADRSAVDRLPARYERLRIGEAPALDRALALLDDARRLGTLPFAHLARHAFVAASILRGLRDEGDLPPGEYDAFLAAIPTVSTRLQRDAHAVADGLLSWDDLIGRYGHLRPGTYDITAPSYAAAPDLFLQPLLAAPRPVVAAEFKWSPTVADRIERALTRLQLGTDLGGFEQFARRAIAGREYAKFVFSRNLSAALDALIEFGGHHDLSPDDLSYLTLGVLQPCRDAVAGDLAEVLRGYIAIGREQHLLTQSIELPPVITAAEQVAAFELPSVTPNFITRRRVTAPLTLLDEQPRCRIDLAGTIVLIPRADPGYDWLFASGIAGLVTMYGGANSHMAIRAAEFQLPAAIGIGARRYHEIERAGHLQLDCAARALRPMGMETPCVALA